uniref:STAT transcription factor DNA-binding domain-containing protein n=1 Tax=Plectus sambesii TaxID=2011161 RepID=A0A914VAQ1_9BILA
MASCATLYQECKDLKQRMVNEDQYIQKLLAFIQPRMQVSNGMGMHPKVQEAQQILTQRQQILNNLREPYDRKMAELINALTTGHDQLSHMQSELFNGQLEEFKTCQMRAQAGAPFNDKEERIGRLKQALETIAKHNIQLRQCAAWMLTLLQTTNDNQDQGYIMNMDRILTELERLFNELISRSFIVTGQPDAVLKTGHKIGTELRLLIAESLGIQPQLDLARITVKIIYEETAQQLTARTANVADVKEVGKISIPVENMDYATRIVTFKNSKLTSVDKRNQAAKGGAKNVAETGDEKLAAARKYALLFQFSPLDVGTRPGKVELWTVSNPLMVTVHTTQVCLAHAAISWHHAFAPVNLTSTNVEAMAVSCPHMKQMLSYKFTQYTGARRTLSDSDLNYLLDKMLGQQHYDDQFITYNHFAEISLADGNFSFWKWFFAVMELIRTKLMDFWNEDYLIGFISKTDASYKIESNGSAHPTFILRFSDSILGALSIGFWTQGEALHLHPFTVKDLDECPLIQRIITCPQLANISYIYPNKLKEQMRQDLEELERKRQQGKSRVTKTEQDKNNTRYYVKHQLTMVVVHSNAPQRQGSPGQATGVQQPPTEVSVESPNFWAAPSSVQTSLNGDDSVEQLMSTETMFDTEMELVEEDFDFDSFLNPMELPPMGLEDIEDVLEVIANN